MIAGDDHRLAQIEHIASREPIGSGLFWLHALTLFFGSILGWLVLDIWWLPAWWVAYFTVFVAEKKFAQHCLAHHKSEGLFYALALLLLRVAFYNLVAIYFWTFDDTVYKFGTLALVVGSTLNSFVNQGRYFSTLACVAIPNALVFIVLAFLEFSSSGWSAQFIASLVVATCIIPYFFVTLMNITDRADQFEKTKAELAKSQKFESMAQVSAGVAHDFNNIMSVVASSLELSKSAPSQAERVELIDTALKATQHASEVTKQMLAMGKNAPLMPRVVELEKTLFAFIQFAKRILSSEHQIILEPANRKIFVSVDPGMFQSAMLNLVLNAKNAMPDGGLLKIEYGSTTTPKCLPQSQTQNGEWAFISMTDTGQGMSKNVLENAFNPFFTTSEIGKGSGLGLSMVKGFVEQSKGFVDLQSTVGKGTTISVFLPVSCSQQVEATREQNEETLSKVFPVKGGGKLVVLVEDNSQLRHLLELKLRRDGYSVVSFENADDAWAEFGDFELVSLVISDQVMPGKLRGTDLLHNVKSRYPSVPFIIMTGYADVKDDGEVDLSSADRFLEKPVALDRLSEAVSELVQCSGSSY